MQQQIFRIKDKSLKNNNLSILNKSVTSVFQNHHGAIHNKKNYKVQMTKWMKTMILKIGLKPQFFKRQIKIHSRLIKVKQLKIHKVNSKQIMSPSTKITYLKASLVLNNHTKNKQQATKLKNQQRKVIIEINRSLKQNRFRMKSNN